VDARKQHRFSLCRTTSFLSLHLKLCSSLTKLNFSDTCKLAQAMMFDLTNLKDYLIEAEKENRKDEFYE